MKKNKVKQHRLNANERPLFAPCHKVHRTAKDKANERQYQKKQLKKDLQNLD